MAVGHALYRQPCASGATCVGVVTMSPASLMTPAAPPIFLRSLNPRRRYMALEY